MSVQENQPDKLKYLVNPAISNDKLNELFVQSWHAHTDMDFESIHLHSLACVVSYNNDEPIGYINIAWDGYIHAFLLNTTVHPDWRLKGIGQALVQKAAAIAKKRSSLVTC